MLKSFLVAVCILVSSFCIAKSQPIDGSGDQFTLSVQYLLRNISAPGTAPGSVIASPSRQDPDYYYHWVRDAALVMDVIVELYRSESFGTLKDEYNKILVDYVDFSRRNQNTANPSGGLGEPKFHVDGSAFQGSWGRPQNDGPALRAITLSRLAHSWLAEGREAEVREKLYDNKSPTRSAIKADLEFVSHHWQDTCFDLWEEIRGHHFYTRMVQRRSLLEGATLAALMGDGGAADWYRRQAARIEQELIYFWNPQAGVLIPTINRDGGIDYKNSGLDTAVLLGVMHGETRDGVYSFSDERVLSTFQRLRATFASIYSINTKGAAGTAAGRYPEDRYDGVQTGREGNPWILTTLAFGEFLHRLAGELKAKGFLEVTRTNENFFREFGVLTLGTIPSSDPRFAEILHRLRLGGDEYLKRAIYHANPGGHFSEQINRSTGFMQGAHDLTWSYASFITAYIARARF